MRDSLRHEVGNEESWLVIDLGCNGTAYCCSDSPRAAAEENSLIGIYRRSSQLSPPCRGIRLALRERGYIEGQNIATEYRYAEGKQDRFPELAAELVRLKVDIIVAAGGNRMVRAAKNATKTIPIVMAGGGSDPVEAGLIESLAHPGGNVTGLTNLTRELGGKRLELLKEAVPKLAHVAVLYDPANAASVRRGERGSPSRGACAEIDYSALGDTSCGRFREGFAAISKQRPDGLYVSRWAR